MTSQMPLQDGHRLDQRWFYQHKIEDKGLSLQKSMEIQSLRHFFKLNHQWEILLHDWDESKL